MADGTFIGNTAQALKDLDTGTAMPISALVAHFYRMLVARGHRHDGGIVRMYADPPPAQTRREGAE